MATIPGNAAWALCYKTFFCGGNKENLDFLLFLMLQKATYRRNS